MKIPMKMAEMTWPEINQAFQNQALIVIPLGAASKEHGYHLPMNNDLIMAEKLSEYIADTYDNVLIAPPITDSYFPAFVEYPGSTSLSLETARQLIVERCALWHQQGAKKFYIVNTGISTLEPLLEAKQIFNDQYPELEFDYLDLSQKSNDPRVQAITTQNYGSHADELETSLMLALAPEIVQLEKAVPEDTPKKPGALTRDSKKTAQTVSPSGAWGNPTLASNEKGEVILKVLHEIIDAQLQHFGVKKL